MNNFWRAIVACAALAASFPGSAAPLDDEAARLAAIEKENAILRRENAALREQVRLGKENAALRERVAPQGATAVPERPATSAYAAAIPVKAPLYKAPPMVAPFASWTGFYLGAGVGFRSSETHPAVTSATLTNPLGTFDISGCGGGFPCFLSGEPVNGTSAKFGPYLGYNWQIGLRWVVGLEVDWSWAKQTTALNPVLYPSSGFVGAPLSSFAVGTKWDASARARVGYLVDPAVLLYATGGPAWLSLEQTSSCGSPSCPAGGLAPAAIVDSATRLGWTIGGGIEAVLWSNWVARAEYRYADFGHVSFTDTRTCPPGGPGCGPLGDTRVVSTDLHPTTHTATFGLAYKFGDPPAAAPLSAYAYAKAPPAIMPSWSWSGPYVGVSAGMRAANVNAATTSFLSLSPAGTSSDLLANCTACSAYNPLNGLSARLGAYAGYDWQFATAWVAGIEADVAWADRRTTLLGLYEPTSLAVGQFNNRFEVRTTWDASLRGRLGYLKAPSFLFYATGGVAALHVEQVSSFGGSLVLIGNAVSVGHCVPGLVAPAVLTHAADLVGWTIGGGGETALWDNWFLRAEYRYADYGHFRNADSRSCQGVLVPFGNGGFVQCTGGATEVASTDVHVRTHTAAFGLTYKFGAPVVAKY